MKIMFETWKIKMDVMYVYAATKAPPNIMEYLYSVGFTHKKRAVSTAASHRNVDLVSYMLDKGLEHSEDLVYYACVGGSIDCLKMLLDKGYKVSDLCGPEIVKKCYWDCIDMFIDRGHYIPSDKASKKAAKHGKIETLKKLIEKKHPLSEAILYSAAKNKQKACLEFLIKEHGLLNSPDQHYSELFQNELAQNGEKDIIEYLAERGIAMPEQAIDYVPLSDSVELLKLFLESKFDPTTDALINAASIPDSKCLPLLIPLCVNREDISVTHEAITKGNVANLSLLLENGFCLQESCVDTALIARKEDSAILLISRGCKISEDSIVYAAGTGCERAAKMILEINPGKTKRASKAASKYGYPNIILMLIQGNFQISKLAVQKSVESEKFECTKMLIDAKCKVSDAAITRLFDKGMGRLLSDVEKTQLETEESSDILFYCSIRHDYDAFVHFVKNTDLPWSKRNNFERDFICTKRSKIE
jgi:hypothetical protein